MDPVNGINQLVQILRQKMSERAPALSQQKPSEAPVSAEARRTETKASLDETKRKIGERIKALSDDDALGPKGAQIFVETVISWEFGDHLLQDSQFSEWSKDIVTTLSDNPTVWRQLQTLLGDLRRL